MKDLLNQISTQIGSGAVSVENINKSVMEGIKINFGLDGLCFWKNTNWVFGIMDGYGGFSPNDNINYGYCCAFELPDNCTEIDVHDFYQFLTSFKIGKSELYFKDTKKSYTDFKEFKKDYLSLKLANVMGG